MVPASQCDDLMHFFVIHKSKLNIFGFWTFSQTKTRHTKTSLQDVGSYNGYFSLFLGLRRCVLFQKSQSHKEKKNSKSFYLKSFYHLYYSTYLHPVSHH